MDIDDRIYRAKDSTSGLNIYKNAEKYRNTGVELSYEKALSKKYGVFGPPAILFFDTDTQLIKAKTIIGFVPANEFLAHLNTL